MKIVISVTGGAVDRCLLLFPFQHHRCNKDGAREAVKEGPHASSGKQDAVGSRSKGHSGAPLPSASEALTSTAFLLFPS